MENFIYEKTINITDGLLAILGKINAEAALVLLRGIPYSQDVAEQIVSKLTLTKIHENDIYKDYTATANQDTLKVTIICPATQTHIDKYSMQEYIIVQETSTMYNEITLPYINSIPKSKISWVYNILEGTSEADRVLYRDENFVLLPDTKWKDTLYCLAIVQDRSLKSVRDLTGDHLPLLEKLRSNALHCILEKFNVPSRQIRVYVHYQPSYYHFHVHFASVLMQNGTGIGKAISFDEVLNHLEMDSGYYQKARLSFCIGKHQELGLCYK